MKTAFESIERREEIFPLVVRNFFAWPPAMPEIVRTFRSRAFEELLAISIETEEATRDDDERECCVRLREFAEFLIRLKLFWVKRFQTQTAIEMIEGIYELFILLQNIEFSGFSRYNLLFEKSLLSLTDYFKLNPELELNPSLSLGLYLHESLLENFKTADNHQQPLTYASINRYLTLLRRGLSIFNLRNSSLNGTVFFLRHH